MTDTNETLMMMDYNTIKGLLKKSPCKNLGCIYLNKQTGECKHKDCLEREDGK